MSISLRWVENQYKQQEWKAGWMEGSAGGGGVKRKGVMGGGGVMEGECEGKMKRIEEGKYMNQGVVKEPLYWIKFWKKEGKDERRNGEGNDGGRKARKVEAFNMYLP